jgi:hypothetical protein
VSSAADATGCFYLSNVVAALSRIERLLKEDDGEEEADGG